MRRVHRNLAAVIGALVLGGMACNLNLATPAVAPGGSNLPALPQQQATASAFPATATNTPTVTPTPLPSATPSLTPTFTPSVVTITPSSKDAVCKFGPGDVYSTEGVLKLGAVVQVLGRDEVGGWLYIQNPSVAGRHCWVSAALTTLQGDPLSVPVQAAPLPFVEGVGVQMKPKTASITCGTFPYTFGVTFGISVNGPATVKFQRSKSNGDVAGVETVVFTASGTKYFDDSYKVGGPGNYWFKVAVTSPNKIAGQGSATMSCTP